jgi:hypothetical protein
VFSTYAFDGGGQLEILVMTDLLRNGQGPAYVL